MMNRCLEKDQVHRPTVTELQEQLQALAAWHAAGDKPGGDVGYGPGVGAGPAVDVAAAAADAYAPVITPSRRLSLSPLKSARG